MRCIPLALASLVLGATFAWSQPVDEDRQWTMPAKDYASTRYSPLAQVTTANAAQLKLAFSFPTGLSRGHEAAPVVVGSTMYVVTPYPNVVYALDLSKPGAPAKWKFEPQPLAASTATVCASRVLKKMRPSA
jgi:glucose dehydrogenase